MENSDNFDNLKKVDNENKTVFFDPGYAPLAIDSLGQVGYNYYVFSAISDLRLKKLKFKPLSIKLNYHLKTNVAFYLGCLLWASYIKQFDNYKIIGNKLLGETCEESEYTGEIDFLLDFILNKYPRDCKYFLNKPYEADIRYPIILEAYKEFLVLNKGFCNCENTSQIILPESLKKPAKADFEKIFSTINKALELENLEEVFSAYELIF